MTGRTEQAGDAAGDGTAGSGAPPDRALAVSILTTEHFTLQGARGNTVSEAGSRIASYLSSLSGALVGIGLLGNVTGLGAAFALIAVVLGLTLVFLGVATFVRVLESGMEDTLYARGINRIRHFYGEAAPGVRPYLILSDRDDMRGVLYNMGLTPGRFQVFLTAAGLVGVINSVLAGAVLGGALAALGVPLTLALPLALAAFGLAVWAHTAYQRRAWTRFGGQHPARFPSGGRADEPDPGDTPPA